MLVAVELRLTITATAAPHDGNLSRRTRAGYGKRGAGLSRDPRLGNAFKPCWKKYIVLLYEEVCVRRYAAASGTRNYEVEGGWDWWRTTSY